MINNYYLRYLNSKRGEVEQLTIVNMNQTLNWIRDYQKKYGPLTFSMINMMFYKNFKDYATKERGCADATFGKHIERIRSFMDWAHEEGYHNERYYKKMPVLRSKGQEEALTSEELQLVWDTNYEVGKVIDLIEKYTMYTYPTVEAQIDRYDAFIRAKDFFYAMCSSGTYINDLSRLTWQNIDIQERIVTYKRFKGRHCKHNHCYFPYMDDKDFKFVELFNKYKFAFERPYYLYDDVKILMKYLGINKFINTKSARKTYASIMYYDRGAEHATVMKMLGHTKPESLQHYLDLDRKVLRKKFEELMLTN